MSVHVYQAIKNRVESAVFSYLDARTLSLVIDARDGASTKVIPVGQSCEVNLNESCPCIVIENIALNRSQFNLLSAVLLLEYTATFIPIRNGKSGWKSQLLKVLKHCRQGRSTGGWIE